MLVKPNPSMLPLTNDITPPRAVLLPVLVLVVAGEGVVPAWLVSGVEAGGVLASFGFGVAWTPVPASGVRGMAVAIGFIDPAANAVLALISAAVTAAFCVALKFSGTGCAAFKAALSASPPV